MYDFDVPEYFEKELKTLIPRHVKFEGVPPGATFHELRDFFAQVRASMVVVVVVVKVVGGELCPSVG